jgi:hypothetical protein
MYEKPQYFTKNGFKRLEKNPYKDGNLKISQKSSLIKKGPIISEKTAKIIAQAIKSMLKEK